MSKETYNYKQTKLLLEVKDVNLTLGGNKILENVNLTIHDIVQEGQIRGQVRSILGPSGVGKSQLLRIIAGLNPPDTGMVNICPNGDDGIIPVQAGMIGVVAQNYPLFRHLTLMDNLLLAIRMTDIGEKEAVEKILSYMDKFNLIERKDLYPKSLSGGQRQRAAILQQILVGRKFLIMDEPFSGLDPKALKKILDLISDLSTENEFNTIIIITHDIASAMKVSDHLHLLGRTFDITGKKVIKAGHFLDKINLIDEGIAWRPNNRELPRFRELLYAIEDQFANI